MEHSVEILGVLTGIGIGYFTYLRYKNDKTNRQRIAKDLKYQRHLQNAFDYQIQMYAFMQAHDAEGFKLASEQVSEELNKCEEILKSK